MFSKKLAALAALSLMTASTAAQAQSAQSLSVAGSPAVERAGPSDEGSNQLTGTTWIIAAVVVGLAIWGIIELTDDSSSP